MSEESATQRLRFAWLVAGAFLVLTVPRLLAHELWRDEAWLWLVVIDSTSFTDLCSRLARSGQGYLFPLLCYLAREVSASPRAMQFVNLLVASSGAFAVARWAPFGRAERALLMLGYIPFYEYAVISRHYAAGAVLLWLACAAARSRRPALGLGAALGLLCQTTVYGYILALAVAGGWLTERVLRRREAAGTTEITPLPRLEVAAGLVLGVGGAIAGLVQLIPEAGTSFAPGWHFAWQPAVAERVLQMPWRAFVLLPRPGLHFWNTNLLDPWPALQAMTGLLALVGAVVFVWPRKAALATLLIGAAGLGAFGYVKFIGALRHDGHWWLLFIAALWLGGGIPSPNGRRSWRAPTFGALLTLHCAVGAYASWMDLRYPFSNAARTAQLIRDRGLDREPLLGYREPPAAPVALALGRPLFAPSRGVFASYPDWGPEQRDLSPEELRCAARGLAERQGRDVVLVMNQELPPWAEVEAAGAVLGAIQSTEDYRLYRLLYGRLQDTASAARCAALPHSPG